MLRSAKARVDDEVGDQLGEVDWNALDPRRYDPRRIVREALLDDRPPRAGGDAPTLMSRADDEAT